MGNKVNVKLWDGTTVSVDEATAAKLNPTENRRETDQENLSRAVTDTNKERTAGFQEGAKTLAEGVADSASAGLFGKLVGASDPEWAENMQLRGQNRPGLRTAGELVGYVAPGGFGSAAAKAGTGLAARTGSKAAGVLAEGAILGAGGAVVATNVSGDPLTVSGVIEDAGIGAIMNYGFAKLADRVMGAGVNAQKSVDAAKQLKSTQQLAAEGEGILGRTESYTTFRDAHVASTTAAKQNNAAAARELKHYEAAQNPANMRKATEQLKKARAEVQAQMADDPIARVAKSTERANKAAEEKWAAEVAAGDEAHAAATTKYESFRDDSEKVNKAFRDLDAVIEDLGKRPQGSVRAEAEADDLMAQLEASVAAGAKKQAPAPVPHEEGEFPAALRGSDKLDHKTPVGKKPDSWGGKSGPDNARTVPGEPAPPSAAPAPQAAPARKPSLGERLKEFRERRSMAAQKLGTWDGKAKRWSSAEGKVADPDAAIAELAQLREDIAAQFPTGRKKKLPDIPTPASAKAEIPRPAPRMVDKANITAEDEMVRMHLAGVSRDLSGTLNEAQAMIKAGDYESAMNAMRGAEARAKQAGMGDLVFPKFPEPPRPLVAVSDVKVPKNLEQFARMRPETVERLAAHIEQADPGVQEAFAGILKELDLAPGQTIGETIRSTHAALGKYTKAMDELDNVGVPRAKGKRGILGKIGDASKDAVRYAAQRGVDIGGWKGAAARTFVGAGVGYAMDGVEGAYLGGSLMAARGSLRGKLSELVAKAAPRTGRAMKRVGPVTAYLQASFPFGAHDPDDNPREAAHRRIGDIISASQAAPDAAYMAVEDLLGHPGDVGFKVHQGLVSAVTYLASTIPRDPGLDVTMSGSNWRPSAEQSLAMAYRMEAVLDPIKAIQRSVQGDGHPASHEALWSVWPALMSEYAQEFMLSDRSNMTYAAESRMANLLNVQVGLRRPEILSTIQGLYLPQPTAPQGQGGGQSSPGTPGRPPASNSSVAGSSVAGLISQ